jgi:hypothetical protein
LCNQRINYPGHDFTPSPSMPTKDTARTEF